MHIRRWLIALLSILTLLAACSDDPNPIEPAPEMAATIHGTSSWDWSQLPHGQNFQAIASDGTGFVIGGARLLTMISGDGRSWVTQAHGGIQDHLAVVLAGDRAVFVGNGTVATVQGAAFGGSYPTGQLRELRDLAWNGQRIVAVGDDGEIVISADGTEWERRPHDILANLTAVAWTAEGCLAAADDGRLYASPDGADWTRAAAPGSAVITGMVEMDGDLFAVCEDGAVWRRRSGRWGRAFQTGGAALRGVAAGSGTVVAVGDGAAIVRWTETDGWSNLRLDVDADLLDVAAGNGFAAIGSGGMLLHSPDGVEWEERPAFAPQDIEDIATNDDEQIAVGRRGIWYREIGGPWQRYYEDPTLGAHAALWTGERFVIACAGGLVLFTDDEGWNAVGLRADRDLWSLHWTGTELIVGGDDGELWRTADFSHWESALLPAQGAIFGIAQSDDRLLAVTTSGEIFTSPDAAKWTLRYEGERIADAVWTGAEFLAIESGAVHRSPDGLAWSAKRSVTDGAFSSLAWDGNRAYAACYDGRIYVSDDLEEWRQEDSGFAMFDFFGRHFLAPNRIRCFGQDVFVAMDGGIVLERRR